MIKSTWFLGGTACPDGDEIRKKVFVNEQKYPISVEFDDHDKTCDHLLLTVDGTPAATARVFMTDEQSAKKLAGLKGIKWNKREIQFKRADDKKERRRR